MQIGVPLETAAGLAFGDPSSIAGCLGDTPDTTKVFTYQTGAFPEGILVSIDNADQSGFNTDPMMWIYAGCGTDALTCRRRYDNTRLSVRSGVVPPRTKLFLGVSDHTFNSPLTFDGAFRTYRGYWTFEADAEQWTLGAWYHSTDLGGYVERFSNAVGPEALVVAPRIYIGGLGSTIRVEFDYGIYDTVIGRVHFAFDGAPATTQNLATTGGNDDFASLDVARPPNSEWLVLSVGFANQQNQDAWMWLYNAYVGAP